MVTEQDIIDDLAQSRIVYSDKMQVWIEGLNRGTYERTEELFTLKDTMSALQMAYTLLGAANATTITLSLCLSRLLPFSSSALDPKSLYVVKGYVVDGYVY